MNLTLFAMVAVNRRYDVNVLVDYLLSRIILRYSGQYGAVMGLTRALNRGDLTWKALNAVYLRSINNL